MNAFEKAKLQKKLPSLWQEEADSMTEQALKSCIVECEVNLKAAEEGMAENEEFQKLKTAYQEASFPLRDAKKAQKLKIAYALVLLAEKGLV